MSTSPATTPPAARNATDWRQHALVLIAILAVTGALLARFLLPLDGRGEAQRMMRDMGAETQLGAITASELAVKLDTGGKATSTLRDALASGDVVVLHFWASWCPPCLEELPELVAFAASIRNRKVTVLAVGYDDDWADAEQALQKAVQQSRPPYIQWWRDPAGQNGEAKSMLRVQFGTEQLPETYVLAQGQILARFIAAQPWTGTKMLRVFELLAPLREAR